MAWGQRSDRWSGTSDLLYKEYSMISVFIEYCCQTRFGSKLRVAKGSEACYGSVLPTCCPFCFQTPPPSGSGGTRCPHLAEFSIAAARTRAPLLSSCLALVHAAQGDWPAQPHSPSAARSVIQCLAAPVYTVARRGGVHRHARGTARDCTNYQCALIIKSCNERYHQQNMLACILPLCAVRCALCSVILQVYTLALSLVCCIALCDAPFASCDVCRYSLCTLLQMRPPTVRFALHCTADAAKSHLL